ncbi:hypothetical protein QE152_g4987 [Popillia japonica]|uniref:PiggyBac transposable element-derived protein domain-containing protein n=1 Tax=Popillia japonica TaxID=7064 RepID=A0AAW1MSG3_POPJA
MTGKYLSDREIEQLFERSDFFDGDNSHNEFYGNAGERDLNFFTSEAEDNVEIVENVVDDITEETDEDDIPLIRFVQQGPSNIYTSKSGFAWNAYVLQLSRRRRNNIVTQKPGPRNNALNINTVVDAFLLYISEEMVNEICMYTNLYCQQTNRQNQNNSSQKEITRDEECAFIAILLAAGRNRRNHFLQSTRRCPFRLFIEILDLAALNAFIIYTEKYSDFMKNSRSERKVFLTEQIGLVKNEVTRRQQGSKMGLQKPMQYAINLLCPQQLEETSTTSNTNTHGNFCPRSLYKKTKFSCTTCRKAVCVTHIRENKRIYCEECSQHQQ